MKKTIDQFKVKDLLNRPKEYQKMSNDEYLKAIGMNRQTRREWFRKNKKELGL